MRSKKWARWREGKHLKRKLRWAAKWADIARDAMNRSPGRYVTVEDVLILASATKAPRRVRGG